MAKINKRTRRRNFRNFEAYKRTLGIKSDTIFDEDEVFEKYVDLHRKGQRNNIFLKEIFFESLPKNTYFTYDFAEGMASRLGRSERTLNKWFTDFLIARIIRRVSKTVFRRMSRFDIQY